MGGAGLTDIYACLLTAWLIGWLVDWRTATLLYMCYRAVWCGIYGIYVCMYICMVLWDTISGRFGSTPFVHCSSIPFHTAYIPSCLPVRLWYILYTRYVHVLYVGGFDSQISVRLRRPIPASLSLHFSASFFPSTYIHMYWLSTSVPTYIHTYCTTSTYIPL